MANYLYDSMCRHIHTSWILLCLLCKPISSLWLQTHVYHHWDDIISVLQWVQYNACLIIFSTCMYLGSFAYILSLSFFGHVFIALIVVSYIFWFAFLLWYLLTKFSHNYTHEMLQNSWFIIVVYFVNAYHCTNFMTLHEILKCCNLPFPAFMTVLTDTHSQGIAKHWSHSSISIHGYLLISTKRSFLRNLYSYHAIYVGVI